MRNTLFYQRLRIGLSAAALIGAVFGTGGQSAFAAGTAQGTSITNLSTLSYKVGTVSQTDIGSSPAGNTSGAGTATAFLVDAKIIFTVTKQDATIVKAGPGTTAVTTFQVANTSNTTLDFNLAAAEKGNGLYNPPFGGVTDNFNATSCTAYAETGGGAGYQAGSDTTTFINELAADSNQIAYVVCAIPATQPDANIDVVVLTATARGDFTGANNSYAASAGLGAALTETTGANTANVDIVFADGAGTDDAARSGTYSDRDAIQVASAQISVQKTATVVCDPFNGSSNPKQIPGSIVRWTIVISNAAGAGASATLATVADTLDVANTTFDPNLVTGVGTVTPATTCSSATGTVEAGGAAGKGFKLISGGSSTRATVGTPLFMTNAAPDNDGASFVSPNVAINYGQALPIEGTYGAGELKPGESVTVYFNATVK